MSADLIRHWQEEAERQSLIADQARAEALQWRRLCAAAILDAARARAAQAVSEGEAYLTLHGYRPESLESRPERS